MIKKPNTRGLTHEQVKVVLGKSDLNCIESKPGLFERKKNVHFIIQGIGTKTKLKVTPAELRYSRVDPGWVFMAPITIYAISQNAFKFSGGLLLLGLFGLSYLIDKATNRSDLNAVVADLDEIINRGSENIVA
jgi:hypothetical protein